MHSFEDIIFNVLLTEIIRINSWKQLIVQTKMKNYLFEIII